MRQETRVGLSPRRRNRRTKTPRRTSRASWWGVRATDDRGHDTGRPDRSDGRVGGVRNRRVRSGGAGDESTARTARRSRDRATTAPRLRCAGVTRGGRRSPLQPQLPVVLADSPASNVISECSLHERRGDDYVGARTWRQATGAGAFEPSSTPDYACADPPRYRWPWPPCRLPRFARRWNPRATTSTRLYRPYRMSSRRPCRSIPLPLTDANSRIRASSSESNGATSFEPSTSSTKWRSKATCHLRPASSSSTRLRRPLPSIWRRSQRRNHHLIWEASTEPDLAGYLVLRGEAPGETLQPLTPEVIQETTYRDTAVTAGVSYVYAVVAVDTATSPNTSAPSNRVQETPRWTGSRMITRLYRVEREGETTATSLSGRQSGGSPRATHSTR